MKSQIHVISIIGLLMLLFYVNIPPEDGSIPNQNNAISYNITVNETVILTDENGNEVGSITSEYNQTIVQEEPQEKKSSLGSLQHLGDVVWPSHPLGGWVVIFLLFYFIALPLLQKIQGRIRF